MQKASLAKGTRDFGPIEIGQRNFIFETIKQVFQCYGFAPIETPAMENLSTLTGKYGDEGDALLFRILNSGPINQENFITNEPNVDLKNKISDKGLRYDLTVPLARYTSINRHKIKMPFKRYQMQPVWRADRPQKGRYREFWQCDADTLGTNSLICELECLEIIESVFTKLDIPVIVHINHRKLLEGIAQELGLQHRFVDFTVAIDKLDKIGLDGVLAELETKGMTINNEHLFQEIITPKAFRASTIEYLIDKFISNKLIAEACEELKTILRYLGNANQDILLDLGLARGLSYYTGAIFEVKPRDKNIGSLAAGGRYDNLTEVFGFSDISGIGISFGADRIYDVLLANEKFPKDLVFYADVLICPLDDTSIDIALSLARIIRNETNKKTIVYPSAQKIAKQLDYANALKISFAIIIGNDEIENNIYTLKNLIDGTQQKLSIIEIKNALK